MAFIKWVLNEWIGGGGGGGGRSQVGKRQDMGLALVGEGRAIWGRRGPAWSRKREQETLMCGLESHRGHVQELGQGHLGSAVMVWSVLLVAATILEARVSSPVCFQRWVALVNKMNIHTFICIAYFIGILGLVFQRTMLEQNKFLNWQYQHVVLGSTVNKLENPSVTLFKYYLPKKVCNNFQCLTFHSRLHFLRNTTKLSSSYLLTNT